LRDGNILTELQADVGTGDAIAI